MRNLILLAWREIALRPFRSLVNILAVTLGSSMVIAADVIGSAARNGTMAMDERNLGAVVGELVAMSVGVASAIILLAAIFLIFNNFAMLITQRRRRIGAMRAAGMSRRQALVLVLLEASLVAWAGVVLACLAGPLIGRGIIGLMEWVGRATGATIAAFAEPDPIWPAVGWAAILGWGVSLLASLIPAAMAARFSPLEGLRRPAGAGARPGNKITHIALALLVILTGWVAVWPPGAWVRPPWNGYLGLALAGLWLILLAWATPWLIGRISAALHRFLARWRVGPAVLIPENLARSRRRAAITALTVALGLSMIIGITGFMHFTLGTVLHTITAPGLERGGFIILPVSLDDSVDAIAALDPDEVFIPPEMLDEINQVIEGSAVPLELQMTNSEALAIAPGMISYVLDPEALRRSELFTFLEGDWEDAIPVMARGCGLLLSPSVAARNRVGVGDRLEIDGGQSQVECVVAGVGNFTFANISIISLAAGEAFNLGGVPGVYLAPNRGADLEKLENDLAAVVARYPGTTLNGLSAAGRMVDIFDRTGIVTNALLLLASLAAGLGVVNTTVAALEERRRELALMRAVGASRAQLTRLSLGEAGAIGLFGGALGLAAGVGGTLMFVLAAGASNWGLYDLPLWPAAYEAGAAAFKTGVFGLLAGPFVSVLAAWLPVRRFMQDDLLRWLQVD